MRHPKRDFSRARVTGRRMLTFIIGIALCLSGAATFGQNCDNLAVTRTTPTAPITGVVNSYYPGASVAPIAGGSRITIKVGTGATGVPGQGAASGLVAGDLVLVMQMQDADINNANDERYGDGTGTAGNVNGDGSGQTALNSAGLYEFARVTASTVASLTSGGTVDVRTTTAGAGLVNTYRDAAATTTQGQRRFQVIRVPQYTSVGIGAALTCAFWNGNVGGVLAIDVLNVCQFTVNGASGSIDVSGRGFRGGAGQALGGAGGGANTDYRTLATTARNGNKGEGIAGTPRFVLNSSVTPNVQVDTGVEGYPNGSRGRGAPGNAGGGGTDGNPGGNDQNSGGGGGGNCGVGGRGGNSFSSNLPVGGFGGASLSANIGATRVFMGGGGGSGARNNSAGVQGSGAPGGGIVLVRAGVFRGIGTVSANGASADLNRPANDGGGGGGGGGTVILAAANASPAPAPQNAITVNVNGGAGSRSDQGGVPHGPGGGGGGGVALLTGTVRTTAVSATGGANGTTVNLTNPFGATSGANGACSVANLALTAIPGVSSGAQCAIASAVTLIDFQARKYSNGQVSVTWKTGYEVDNLGFNVYRESNGRRSRLTSEMVAGSALLVGAGTELTAGQGYAWRDIIGEKSEGVGYWLEAIDLKGESVWYGPFPAISASEPFPASVRNAPVLGWSNSRLGVERGDVAISPVRAAATNAAGVQRSAATALVDDPASAFQKQLAARATVKLGVSVTGWQTVSLSALRAAGLSATANLNNLQLYVQGRQIPIRVTGSAIEFYGEAADTLQSGTQTYWLTEGTQTGLRISVPVRPRLGAPVPGGYPFVVERRDKTTYFAALLNGDEDNFFGSVVASAPVEQVVSVRDRETASTEPAELAVTLQGVTENIEHQVSVQVNGQPVGQILFEGRGQRTETFAVPAGQLRDGQNVVTLQGAGGNDVTLVGGVRLRYVRQYRAENDSLVFSATGGQTVRVAGFTQAARVVDVTNPTAPIEAFIRMEGTAATGLTATFLAPGAGVRKLVAFPATSVLSPSVAANRPSTWHQASNAADLAIITTRGLSDAVQALATARQNQGLRVAIVDVEDLYDEFNFGVKSSQAIKDFLRVAARQWSGPVRFALFVGDATFDPRNYLGLGDNDAVPTKLIETRRLETASDDWFGDFDDSGASEVAIGRLTARTADEAAAMTAKILAYEQSGGAAWRNEVLFVADNNDEGGDFEQAAALVQSELPPTMNASVAFLGQSDRESVRTQALAGIANGKALINYIGHGSSGNWAAENLLTSSDVQSMTGTGRSSVIVGMTCLNGFFQDVFTDCLAKALLRKPQGGAAAVWASSSLTEEPTQNLLNRAFVREAYGASGATTIGEAIRRAKLAIPDDDVRRSWTLLGDPSMPIR